MVAFLFFTPSKENQQRKKWRVRANICECQFFHVLFFLRRLTFMFANVMIVNFQRSTDDWTCFIERKSVYSFSVQFPVDTHTHWRWRHMNKAIHAHFLLSLSPLSRQYENFTCSLNCCSMPWQYRFENSNAFSNSGRVLFFALLSIQPN